MLQPVLITPQWLTKSVVGILIVQPTAATAEAPTAEPPAPLEQSSISNQHRNKMKLVKNPARRAPWEVRAQSSTLW